MPEETIRIRVAVGDVEIEFRGRRRFFERRVEPLLRGCYRGGSAPAHEARPLTDAAAGSQRATAGRAEEAARPASAPPPPEPVFHPSSPTHFQQFTGQVGDNADTVDRRIMAFAFYLWNYERQEAFEPADLEAFFRTVLEEPPQDLTDRLQGLAEQKRFLEPDASTPGAWRLTTKGVNYVKNRLLAPTS